MTRLVQLLFIVAAVGALGGGAILWKYETTDPCEAAAIASREEAPEIMAEFARRKGLPTPGADGEGLPRFPRLAEGLQAPISDFVEAGARERLAEKGPFACLLAAAYREINPAGFRGAAVDELEKRMAERF